MPRPQFTLKALLWLMAGSKKFAQPFPTWGQTNAKMPVSREAAKARRAMIFFAASRLRETPLPLLIYHSTTD
jgi:hypothetical protein